MNATVSEILVPGRNQNWVHNVHHVVVTTREFLGGDSGRVIPDPIPNSVVKPSNVDGTAKVTLWESRTLPGS